MTGQDLLNAMEALNQELQLQTSEADVARGLIALNMAQDYFESLAAQEGHIQGDSTADITTAANTETTSFPTGMLRIDLIQYIDPVTEEPVYDLDSIQETGGHIQSRAWPLNVTSSLSSRGIPTAYWTNGRFIYWSPKPDAVHTFRTYGFSHAADITATDTFSYDDELRLPFAAFAVQILRIGVGDEIQDVAALAKQTFSGAIGSMASVNRDGASGFTYRYRHDS